MVRRVLDILQEVTHVSSRMSEFESYYVSLQRVSAPSGGADRRTRPRPTTGPPTGRPGTRPPRSQARRRRRAGGASPSIGPPLLWRTLSPF